MKALYYLIVIWKTGIFGQKYRIYSRQVGTTKYETKVLFKIMENYSVVDYLKIPVNMSKVEKWKCKKKILWQGSSMTNTSKQKKQ